MNFTIKKTFSYRQGKYKADNQTTAEVGLSDIWTERFESLKMIRHKEC